MHLAAPKRRLTVTKRDHVVLNGVERSDAVEVHVRADRASGHEDVYVPLHDAFDAARRQVDDHARAQRGEVKHHEGRTV
jgi:hypothetical protein